MAFGPITLTLVFRRKRFGFLPGLIASGVGLYFLFQSSGRAKASTALADALTMAVGTFMLFYGIVCAMIASASRRKVTAAPAAVELPPASAVKLSPEA